MTTISDTLRNPAGVGVGGVTVRATLVAASEVLSAGGAIIREAETTTASDGAWSLTLTPISSLAVNDGAYYLITADGHRWEIDVPDSGTYDLAAVLTEPGPLSDTSAIKPTVLVWDGDSYNLATGAHIKVGGPGLDGGDPDGSIWIDLGD